jgi:hypothetical protein
MNNDNPSMDDFEIMELTIERLTIENGLLRAASKEQRKLNGELRVEIMQLRSAPSQTSSDNSDALFGA